MHVGLEKPNKIWWNKKLPILNSIEANSIKGYKKENIITVNCSTIEGCISNSSWYLNIGLNKDIGFKNEFYKLELFNGDISGIYIDDICLIDLGISDLMFLDEIRTKLEILKLNFSNDLSNTGRLVMTTIGIFKDTRSLTGNVSYVMKAETKNPEQLKQTILKILNSIY